MVNGVNGRIVNLGNFKLINQFLTVSEDLFKFMFKSFAGGHKRVECTVLTASSRAMTIKWSRKTFLFQRSISLFVRFMNVA